MWSSTGAMHACQDTEELEGSRIQVMENTPASVIAVLRAALAGFKAGADPALHILLETGTVEPGPWHPSLKEARS